MRDLGTLPGLRAGSRAAAINDRGQVAGSGRGTDPRAVTRCSGRRGRCATSARSAGSGATPRRSTTGARSSGRARRRTGSGTRSSGRTAGCATSAPSTRRDQRPRAGRRGRQTPGRLGVERPGTRGMGERDAPRPRPARDGRARRPESTNGAGSSGPSTLAIALASSPWTRPTPSVSISALLRRPCAGGNHDVESHASINERGQIAATGNGRGVSCGRTGDGTSFPPSRARRGASPLRSTTEARSSARAAEPTTSRPTAPSSGRRGPRGETDASTRRAAPPAAWVAPRPRTARPPRLTTGGRSPCSWRGPCPAASSRARDARPPSAAERLPPAHRITPVSMAAVIDGLWSTHPREQPR